MGRWIARYWRHSAAGAGLLAAVCLALLALAGLLLPFSRWVAETDATSAGVTSPEERLAAIDAVRGRVLQVSAGLGVLLTLVTTLLTYRLSLLRHRTEHIGRAVAQLGAAHAFERTGGVLELEQIMRRWPGLHAEIVDVLAAFVRERTRATSTAAERTRATSAAAEPGEPAVPAVKTRPDAAVQAALSVLVHRRDRGGYDKIVLSDTDLRGAVLREGNLRRVNLRRALLQDCHFEKTHLEEAKLRGAHLEGADLEGAHLEGANLSGAHLNPWVRTWGDPQPRATKLAGAHLDRAELRRTDLRGARLSGAVLRGADLTGADLRDADLTGADLRGADLTAVLLKGAHMTEVRPAELSTIGAHCHPAQQRHRIR